MRVSLKELCTKLGVGHLPGPYETVPFSAYDPDGGTTCSAELRMEGSGEEMEAEVQFMREVPAEGQLPMEQVCSIRATLRQDGNWEVEMFRLRGKKFGEEFSDWREKACKLFEEIVSCLKDNEIPDIDDLVKEIFREGEGADRTGSGGKAPKFRAEKIMSPRGR